MFLSRRALAISAGALALTVAVTGLAGAYGTAPAAGVQLGFDDLGATTVGTHMVDGYGGMRWSTSDYYVMANAANPADGYLALSGTATAFTSVDGADFTFKGLVAFSRRGLDATGAFYYVLYHDGVTVYNGLLDSKGKQKFTGTPTTFLSPYAGPVDGVAIAFAQGKGDWDHLAIDNVGLTPIDTTTAPTTVAPTTVAPTPNPVPAGTYKLTIKTNGKGFVTSSRTGDTFVAGQEITLTATPAAGSSWFGWTGSVVSSESQITFTMNSDMVITANFR